MDNQIHVKCPKCDSENVIVIKRGYSLAYGFGGMVLFFIAYAVFWIITSDYANQDETTKTLMIAFAEKQFLFAALFGLLLGFIGKNKLEGKCLNCGKKFPL